MLALERVSQRRNLEPQRATLPLWGERVSPPESAVPASNKPSYCGDTTIVLRTWTRFITKQWQLFRGCVSTRGIIIIIERISIWDLQAWIYKIGEAGSRELWYRLSQISWAIIYFPKAGARTIHGQMPILFMGPGVWNIPDEIVQTSKKLGHFTSHAAVRVGAIQSERKSKGRGEKEFEERWKRGNSVWNLKEGVGLRVGESRPAWSF